MVLHLLAHLYQLRMQLQQTSRGGGTTSENVVIPDPNLKAALLEEMKSQYIIKKDATEITKDDALKVKMLKSRLMEIRKHFGPLVDLSLIHI